jgi:hypothetical protein
MVGAGWGVVVSAEVCTTDAGTRRPVASAGVWPVSGQEKGPLQRRTLLPTSLFSWLLQMTVAYCTENKAVRNVYAKGCSYMYMGVFRVV